MKYLLTLLLAFNAMFLVAQSDRESKIANDINRPGNSWQMPAPRGDRQATVFSEDFESAWPPTGWTVTDVAGSGFANWDTATSWGESNYTGGTGECAMACSDCDPGAFNTVLESPTMDCSGFTGVSLDFMANFADYAGEDFFEVDVSNDGGMTWNNVLQWNEDHGSLYATPGEAVSLDISAYADGEADVRLRFHYYSDLGTYQWYVQVDDVEVGAGAAQPTIPTLGTWGLVGFIGLLMVAGVFLIRRRAA